jgi:hypothetical protein
MIVRMKEAAAKGALLNEFIPVPEDLHIIAGCVGDPQEQAALEAKEKANREKHGYANWYDWCVNEWGTKWDVECDIVDVKDNEITLYFDSAWAPPINAYEKLEDLGFTIDGYYYEPGMAYCGKYTTEFGDDFFEIGELRSDQVRDAIGDELDDVWQISETMAEYEAENEEELTQWVRTGAEAVKEKAND